MCFQSLLQKISVALFTCFVCVASSAVGNPYENKPIDRKAELDSGLRMLDSLEPWIQTANFEGFVRRLDLSEEQDKVIKQRWDQFEQRRNILKQDAAEAIWESLMSKLFEAEGDIVGAFGIEGARKVYNNSAKSMIQIIRKFALHRSEFLDELREQLQSDEVTWSRALLWLRRQPLLRDPDHSWMDLMSYPDLIDQFDQFMLEDEVFLPLAQPTTKEATESAEAIQVILEDWALQIDGTVDTYLIDHIRKNRTLRLSRLTPDKKDWLAAVRMYKIKGQRRYRFIWSTSEHIASLIELAVGPWAAERWRRATELAIFPESCPLNSFEHVFPSILGEVDLADEEEKAVRQLLLPMEKKLARLRSSMRKASLWYEANMDIKYAGFDVPPFLIDIPTLNTKYRETIDTMIDVLADAMPAHDWDAQRKKIDQSREHSDIDRYNPRIHIVAQIMFAEEKEE